MLCQRLGATHYTGGVGETAVGHALGGHPRPLGHFGRPCPSLLVTGLSPWLALCSLSFREDLLWVRWVGCPSVPLLHPSHCSPPCPCPDSLGVPTHQRAVREPPELLLRPALAPGLEGRGAGRRPGEAVVSQHQLRWVLGGVGGWGQRGQGPGSCALPRAGDGEPGEGSEASACADPRGGLGQQACPRWRCRCPTPLWTWGTTCGCCARWRVRAWSGPAGSSRSWRTQPQRR